MSAPTSLDGPRVRRKPEPGEITDSDEIARIAARIAYGSLPWRQRIVTRRPAGWGRS